MVQVLVSMPHPNLQRRQARALLAKRGTARLSALRAVTVTAATVSLVAAMRAYNPENSRVTCFSWLATPFPAIIQDGARDQRG